MNYEPSPQQQDFFDWVEEKWSDATPKTKSCVLEAVAGSGKTTTLVHAVSRMDGFIFFGAFNKKIAEEIKTKVSHLNNAKLTVSTMHAEGFKMWRKVAKQVKVDGNKCKLIFRERVDYLRTCGSHEDADTLAKFESQILKLTSLAKQSGCGVLWTDRRKWFDLIDRYDVDCTDEDEFVVKAATGLLKKSVSMDYEVIDFDDMIYSPLAHGCRPFQYDWVLIDEAQDTNATRRELALRILKPGGRLVAVGDRHQAIYGFTGADSDALDLIRDAVDAGRMPLTVTYRCPKKIVEHAHQWVKHIHAHESAPDGQVITISPDKKLQDLAKPGDAIICRFNAPLLSLVYGFIGEGIPAKIEGREIGSGLKVLVSRWKVRSFDSLLDKLEKHLEKEVLKYTEKDQPNKVQAIEDKVACLEVIINRCMKTNVDEGLGIVERVCKEIDRIFDDNVSGRFVSLSTIHKSKGREWKNVFWFITPPSKWAKQPWQMEQEDNLRYVVTTRAMETLYLYESTNNTATIERKIENTDDIDVEGQMDKAQVFETPRG